MAERIQIVEHEGHSIAYVDVADQETDVIVATIQELTKVCIREGVRLIVLDVTNTRTNAEIKRASRDSIAEVERVIGKPHSAIVGLSGMQRIIANAIMRGQHFARSREDALDWVVKKAEAEKA